MKKLSTLLFIAFIAISSAFAATSVNGPIRNHAIKGVENKLPELKLTPGKFVKNATATTNLGVRRAPAAAFDCTIELSNITATTVDYAVTPADASAYYAFSVIPAEYFEEYGEAGIAEALKSNMDYYIDLYAQYGMESSYADFTYSGVEEDTYDDLDPETEYVAFAYQIDTETGEAASAFATKTFTTEAVVASDNVVTMSYSDGVITIKTTNDDPYVFAFETMEEFNEYQNKFTTETCLEELQSWIDTFKYYDMMSYMTFVGDQEINVSDYYGSIFDDDMESGDWVAFAAPYNAVINGELAVCQFTYTAPEVVVTEEKDIHIVSPKWVDYVAEAGWWQISGYTADDAYYASLSNNDTYELAGTYTKADMDADFTKVYKFDETGDYEVIKFSDITVDVAVDEDGKVTIKSDFTGKDGVLYHITFDVVDSANLPVEGNSYDMKDADVEATFSTEDGEMEYDEEYACWFAQYYTADNEYFSLALYSASQMLEDGEYPINDTYEAGSVQAGDLDATQGGYVYPTYYATLNNEGYLNVPLFLCTAGTVTVSHDADEEVQFEVNATNTWGRTAHIKVVSSVTNGIKNVTTTKNVQKSLENNKLVIEKNGKKFNAVGAQLK